MQKIAAYDPTVVETAVAFLTEGGIIVYPTDTVYGFGVDAENAEAVAKLYALKARKQEKDVLVAVTDLGMAEKYGIVDDRAIRLAKHFLPGPLSLVLPRHPGSETSIGTGSSSIGIRIPNHPLALALISGLGRGITSTSVNKSGDTPLMTPQAIEGAFKDDIALLIDAGEQNGLPSTLVDLTGVDAHVLREGPISNEAVNAALEQ